MSLRPDWPQQDLWMPEQAGDAGWMLKALALARKAWDRGEVPVGAVLVRDGELLAEGFNAPILLSDPTAHAEIQALRAASTLAQNYRLPGATLYVTLEPCLMCAGAMMHARIDRIVFATRDPKTGVAGSVIDAFSRGALNHQTRLTEGVCADEAAQMLRAFFAQRRQAAKQRRIDAGAGTSAD